MVVTAESWHMPFASGAPTGALVGSEPGGGVTIWVICPFSFELNEGVDKSWVRYCACVVLESQDFDLNLHQKSVPPFLEPGP